MRTDAVLNHIRRARQVLESAQAISHNIAYAEALQECERVIAATGGITSGVLDVETELAVLRQATCYDDLTVYDARGRAYARAERMSSYECDRLRVAVLRLERFFTDDCYPTRT